jgi:quercetin dioxygenase-like cupin family protein
MSKYYLSKLITYSKGGITSKVILKSSKLNITLFCMAAGTEMSEHTSTREGTVYVIEGDGIFMLENNSIPMKQDVLIHMKANQAHSLSAKKNTSFLLTLIN